MTSYRLIVDTEQVTVIQGKITKVETFKGVASGTLYDVCFIPAFPFDSMGLDFDDIGQYETERQYRYDQKSRKGIF